MPYPIELSGPDICCPMYLNTHSGGIDIFEVKLTFDMLTVRGLQHLFSTHERVFLWKCRSFWDRKCLDLRGTRTTNNRIHAKCSTLFSYQGQTFAVPCFWTLAIIMISKNVIKCAIINDWVTLWTESVIIRRPTQTRLLILFGEKIKKKYLNT